MSVLVSQLAGTTLSAVNGFLKAEVYNLGLHGTTDLPLSYVPRDINITFPTGSRKNAGVILAFEAARVDTNYNVRVSLQQIMGSCTANATTEEITFAGHGFVDGQPVMFSAATAPGGITLNTGVYYARPTDSSNPTNTFFLYGTQAQAIAGGSAGKINITSAGSSVILYADRGVSDLTSEQIYNDSMYRATSIIVPFTWTGYTIDTSANKWRFHIFQYGGTISYYLLRTSDNTNIFHCEISDIAVSATNDDALVLAGPVTVDCDFTAKGVLGIGDSVYAHAIIICKSLSALTSTSETENLVWDGSASRTLTVNGCILMACQSGFRAGKSTARIESSKMGTVSFIAPTVGTQSGFLHCDATTSSISAHRQTMIIYGERPAIERTTFIGDIAAGATTLQTAIETGWLAGTTFCIGKVTNKAYADDTLYTLTEDASDVNLTFTPAIPVNMARTSGGRVFRTNGYGFKITGPTSGSVARFRVGQASNFILDGVQICYFGGDGTIGTGYFAQDDYASKHIITHIVYHGNVSVGGLFGTAAYCYIPKQGVSITHSNCQRSNFAMYSYAPGSSGDSEFSNNWIINLIGGAYNYFSCSLGTIFTDNVFENNIAGLGVQVKDFDFIFRRNKFWGIGVSSSVVGAVLLQGAYNPKSWGENYYDNCLSAVRFGAASNFDLNNLADDVWNSEAANNYDVAGQLDCTSKAVFINTAGINKIGLIKTATSVSFWRFINFGNVLDDFRSYYRQGRFLNPNQGSSIMQISQMSTEELTNRYLMASKDISGFKVLFCVSGQIQNALYYAGTYELPKIKIQYDDDSEVSSDMSANLDQQNFILPFTTTRDYKDISINFITKSDASEADVQNIDEKAAVIWSNAILNIRKYGYVFGSYPLTINQTTDAYLASIAKPASNPYITQADAATVFGYAEFNIDHAAQTVTISADTTLKRLYDFSQYDLTLDANGDKAEWLTTIDGVNYASAYDIVLNTGVDLTGGGTINMGARTFTRTGTATYDGILIYSASREVHVLLNGLVSGSTVQIYDNDAEIELYNSVMNGDTVNHVMTWTVDHELRIRVRKAGKIPFEYTGDVTQNGLSLNIAQEVDAVYSANAIDGSTVDEYYLFGTDIMIYVNDDNDATTAQRMYNWYMHAIATTDFIGIQPNAIIAQTPWSYVLADAIKISNQKAESQLFLSGANINNVSGNGQVIDQTAEIININGYFPFNSAGDIRAAVIGGPGHEVTATPTATSTLEDKITWLFEYFKHQRTVTATEETLYDEGSETVIGRAPIAKSTASYTKGEMV